MSLYAEATSCAQGEALRFRLLDGEGGPIAVEDVPSGRLVLRDAAAPGPAWTLKVGSDWPSSLYRAIYHDFSAYFVVRAAAPASPILVSIPFPTWEAYNRPGVPGEGLYQSEQPDRAVKVTFDRPGAGPQIEEWELGLLRWLDPAGYTVDYCSGLDLHGGLPLLSRYRLLVVNGHDEYWSWEMRDAAEEFARRGGNIAIFSGNTCWWQVRFEDDLRTMVCYRDAATDPLAATDPGRVTVEWPNEPVNRPENTLTGLSFRNGAGCWVDSRVMAQESYTARFTDHWVFEGTGLADGDTFGRGAIGYETDAADLEWVAGVPRASGRDGTPPSFVVLATADLSHWRRYGKGGAATMGVHRLGSGTVFNAGTINWGNTLHDPVLATITRNVLNRLSHPPPTPTWDPIGPTPHPTQPDPPAAAPPMVEGGAPAAAPPVAEGGPSTATPQVAEGRPPEVAPLAVKGGAPEAALHGPEEGTPDAAAPAADGGTSDVVGRPASAPAASPARAAAHLAPDSAVHLLADAAPGKAREGTPALAAHERDDGTSDGAGQGAESDGLHVTARGTEDGGSDGVGQGAGGGASHVAAHRTAGGRRRGGAVRALVCCESRLYAVCPDGTLAVRDVSGQNLPWQTIGETDALALAAPREAHGGPPAGLYGVAPDGTIRYRDPVEQPRPWRDVSRAPDGTIGLAAVDEGLFAVTAAGELWHLPIRRLDEHDWRSVGPAAGTAPPTPATPVTISAASVTPATPVTPAAGLTAMNGRLFAMAADRILIRTAERHEAPWNDLGPAAGCTALAATGGRLIGAGPDGLLRWRSL
ncbi:hypothetical protein FH608_014485 [Nonomuraea phyllanthi]|uniref:N,N-dimethylformamidase beta subunit-like C-terminal domain-containing protein n=1 Tax=Nonomuraea phyllanthi TaxID=2219224 RepID=A0A5C4WKA7_9ACTN|nr:N,N-dimethylformamidase beta subunit family domain-containing protein [Nonomuraea phyllanthi]KAB8194435.1 hypothetical protein FH608_014485 [Nonomuraea phyllanthi]